MHYFSHVKRYELEDAGVSEVNICMTSAKTYLDGKKDQDAEMIEDSGIEQLEDMLSDKSSTKYTLERKCQQQWNLIHDFINQIKDKELQKIAKVSDYEKMKIQENKYKIQEEIYDTKRECIDIIDRKLTECLEKMTDILMRYIKGESLMSSEDIMSEAQAVFNDYVWNIQSEIKDSFQKLQKICNTEYNDIKNVDTIFVATGQNTDVHQKSNNHKLHLGAGFRDGLFKFSKKIDKMAEPVKVGEERHIFRKNKVIMSKKGGEGTELNRVVQKIPVLRKIGNASGKISKVAGFVQKNQILINVAVLGVDLIQDVREEYANAKNEREIRRVVKESNERFCKVIETQKRRLKQIVDQQTDTLISNLDKVVPVDGDDYVGSLINEADRELMKIRTIME